MKVFLLLLLCGTFSCTNKDLGPEAALKDFVDGHVGKVVDRNFVLERVSGIMLENFKNMPAEQFEKIASMKDITTDSFKILAKNCADNKCFLTYSINYFTKNSGSVRFSSEVKKTAELVQIENKWLIADVNNIQTFHESLEPINLFQ